MPRAFDITAATDAVTLDASGHGELAFTVSNALRMPMRARATVHASGDARPEWMAIEGDAERHFPADGTQQFIVRFKVPPGTAPGRYTFQLLVADVLNPDEHYAQGPTVAFTVAQAPPPAAKKPFPWLLVALAAGVLVIIGTVVAVLAGRGGAELGEPCAEEACGPGLDCDGTRRVCVGQEGFQGCQTNEQCATGRCTDGTCVEALAAIGESCAELKCQEGLVCPEATKVCLGPEGFLGCKEDSHCVTTRCTSGVCILPAPGGACGPGNTCPPDQKCASVLGPRACLMQPGKKCDGDVQCSSLYCRQGTCTRDDGKCESSADCKGNFRCQTNKLCMIPNFLACPSSVLCASGNCVNGICQPPKVACSPPCTGDFIACVGGRCVARPAGMMVFSDYQAELRRIASQPTRGGFPSPAATGSRAAALRFHAAPTRNEPMPRAFDITVATDSVNLDASGQGEIAFTVSNALRMPMRARATVLPAGGARPEWLSVAGGAERDFAADGTQQIIVRIQVPPGTAPGRFTFQLLVADVTDPDERYAQGPTVAFVLAQAAPPPPKKPFPWMLVALIAGVVIIIGAVIAVLSGRGGLAVGEPCGPGQECGKGLECSGVDGGECLGVEGFEGCSRNEQCLTGLCQQGRCARVPPGGKCAADGTCPPDQKCVQVVNERFCLLVPAEKCERDLDCSSLYCKQGTCTRDDGKCETNDDCKAPSQCTPNKLCLLPDGAACTQGIVCMSGFCPAGTCAPAPSGPCTILCPPGTTCVGNQCIRLPDRSVNQQLFLQEPGAFQELQIQQDAIQRQEFLQQRQLPQ